MTTAEKLWPQAFDGDMVDNTLAETATVVMAVYKVGCG
jgi:hypothetical protein